MPIPAGGLNWMQNPAHRKCRDGLNPIIHGKRYPGLKRWLFAPGCRNVWVTPSDYRLNGNGSRRPVADKPALTIPGDLDYQSGYANINETWEEAGSHYLQRTTAVGIYPQGDSLQGVSDLSGNVWEWCLNAYEEPANTQSSGVLRRVVRGGSWINALVSARASYRYYNSPVSRNYYFGFRVCCVSPI